MLERRERGGVVYLASTLIRSRHGFSTRIGGVSTLPHTASLNLAAGHGDSEETVAKNLSLLSDALGVVGSRIISVPQIHSADVRIVLEDDAGLGTSRPSAISCDGYATAFDGLPIAVKTADCVPILLEARDGRGNVIAVAAVHAGWRGTAERIAERAVRELVALGAEREGIYAAIGPAIDVCCYEVKEDFANAIREKLGLFYENNYILKRENRLFADIKGMNESILRESGVPAENIDICTLCTCCNEELFYSHRRQRGVRGSMMSVICK